MAAAAPTLPIPTVLHGGVLAARTLTVVPAAGGLVLVGMAGFFMPPRLLVAPAGRTRLPRGVRAVVAVPAAPAPGSGGPGSAAMRWAVAAVAAAAPADDDDNLQDDDVFYRALEAYGVEALELLSGIEPPAHLIRKAGLVKDALEKAVNKAKAKDDSKINCVMALLYGIYGVVDLGEECALPPKQYWSILNLNNHHRFHVLAALTKVDDNKAMMESVTRALRIARDILRRCTGRTPPPPGPRS